MGISILLVANRGEIACRVIRTARAMGVHTVAVYSDADAGAPHVKAADEAVAIGPAPAAESYLDIDRILAAAEATGADAIHPGYGFLSENAAFAEAVEEAGLIFVGPSPHAIDVMGDKARAKRAMIAAGVPCVPGYQGADQSEGRLLAEAAGIGFPLMVKAAAGGGGRGMRLVADAAALPAALAEARAEAASAFGAGDLILEKAILRPRHVEIQVLADAYGACIHLGERDCSVQRRHQKVIEEAPSPAVDADLRAAMGAAAVAAARAVAYRGAGTVEFLLDEAGAFHFLEMNTRLQVEHPVTEMATGLDLVEWQLKIAEGAPLTLAQEDVRLTGHAIEARLYAEDPAAGFLPSPGPVRLWRPPAGARVDAGIETGGAVPAEYDPMVAKLIVHAPSREQARLRLIRALGDTALFGPRTNRAFLANALAQPAFALGEATTAFIAEAYGPAGFAPRDPDEVEIAFAGALAHALAARHAAGLALAPPAELSGWSSAGALVSFVDLALGGAALTLRVEMRADVRAVAWAGRERIVSALEVGAETASALVDGERIRAAYHADAAALALAFPDLDLVLDLPRAGAPAGAAAAGGAVTAPMHGLLVELRVAAGSRVAAGDTVAVLEAMKMRHEIAAPRAGVVGAPPAAAGAQLAAGDLIATIEAEEDET